MIRCPECSNGNYHGALFCAVCGAVLRPPASAVRVTTQPQTSAESSGTLPTSEHAGTRAPRTLLIRIDDIVQSIVLSDTPINIGRADPESGFMPELDLASFGGLERGVSRHHARLQRTGESLTLTDENSSNGTWLNGIRLLPEYPYPVAKEATIRFGDLVVHLSTVD